MKRSKVEDVSAFTLISNLIVISTTTTRTQHVYAKSKIEWLPSAKCLATWALLYSLDLNQSCPCFSSILDATSDTCTKVSNIARTGCCKWVFFFCHKTGKGVDHFAVGTYSTISARKETWWIEVLCVSVCTTDILCSRKREKLKLTLPTSSADKMFQCFFTTSRISRPSGERVVLNTQKNGFAFWVHVW